MLIKVKLRASNLRTPESRQRPKALLSPMGRPSKPVNDRRQAAPPGRDKKPHTLNAEASRSSPASSKGSPAPTTRAECSERLPQAVPGHACSLDKAARVLEVRGQSGDRILHLGRRSWLPEGQPWGRLQGAAMARGAWCSNPILPCPHTPPPSAHTHTHTHPRTSPPHTHNASGDNPSATSNPESQAQRPGGPLPLSLLPDVAPGGRGFLACPPAPSQLEAGHVRGKGLSEQAPPVRTDCSEGQALPPVWRVLCSQLAPGRSTRGQGQC